MLAYPFSRDSATAAYMLPDDPVQILRDNLHYRTQGFFGIPWPPHWFAVGDDGSGNAYYLDLSIDPSPVFLADHETGKCGEAVQDFGTWIKQLKAEDAEGEVEEQSRRNLLAWLKRWFRPGKSRR
jgi:hypothetical protein